MDLEVCQCLPEKKRECNLGSAKKAVESIYTQLLDETHVSTLELAPCGPEILSLLRKSANPFYSRLEAYQILEHLERISEEEIKSNMKTQNSVPVHVRRLYTDCRLLQSLLNLQDEAECHSDDVWLRAIQRLDMAIIVSGAPGESRLDLCLDTIHLIQSQHLPLTVSDWKVASRTLDAMNPSLTIHVETLAANAIPRIAPPSFLKFCERFSAGPFILSGYIRDWPALNEHPWCSFGYLQRIAGRGRIVPVEVGSDYRAEEWDQKLMPWEDFLREIGVNLETDEFVDNKTGTRPEHSRQNKKPLYLAQHNLLTQFPMLRSDIIVPDYVYVSLPESSGYRPPNNEEQLVINAWLGPKGTVSPAHTDPYFNFYAQVAGCKTVWLAPPRFREEMYPFSDPHAPHTARNTTEDVSPQFNEVQGVEQLLTNTSRVDVFAPSCAPFPLFEASVRRHALCATLEPGDMLYIPAGWWHAMRSEDISFSVSMWF